MLQKGCKNSTGSNVHSSKAEDNATLLARHVDWGCWLNASDEDALLVCLYICTYIHYSAFNQNSLLLVCTFKQAPALMLQTGQRVQQLAVSTLAKVSAMSPFLKDLLTGDVG